MSIPDFIQIHSAVFELIYTDIRRTHRHLRILCNEHVIVNHLNKLEREALIFKNGCGIQEDAYCLKYAGISDVFFKSHH